MFARCVAPVVVIRTQTVFVECRDKFAPLVDIGKVVREFRRRLVVVALQAHTAINMITHGLGRIICGVVVARVGRTYSPCGVPGHCVHHVFVRQFHPRGRYSDNSPIKNGQIGHHCQVGEVSSELSMVTNALKETTLCLWGKQAVAALVSPAGTRCVARHMHNRLRYQEQLRLQARLVPCCIMDPAAKSPPKHGDAEGGTWPHRVADSKPPAPIDRDSLRQ